MASIKQAGIEALADFLSRDSSLLTNIPITPFWVERDIERYSQSITIISAGSPSPVDVIIPTTAGGSRELSPPDPIRKEWRYDVELLEQPIQFDLWAESDVGLDEMEGWLELELRRGERHTLGKGGEVRDGLLLALNPNSGHEGFADLTVNSGPSPFHSPDANLRNDWRSVVRATLSLSLSIWAEHARQVQIVLNSQISAGALGTAPTEQTTLQRDEP